MKQFQLKTLCLAVICMGIISCNKNNPTEPEPDPELPSLVPAPRIEATVIRNISGYHDEDYLRLCDNRGRVWTRPLPMDTDIVFKLPRPLSHIVFQWMSSGGYNYDVPGNGPGAYRIQVSSNSTDGSNGAWETAVTVQNNVWAARAHEIKGANIQWIRFRITAGGTTVDEFDIHDLSQSKSGDAVDTWAFIGDSNTADTYWRDDRGAPLFNEQVHSIDPSRFPSMINFGIGGNNSGHLLARLQQTIDNNRGIHFWAVCIGSNDGNATQFEQNLKSIIQMLIDNGKQPVIARIPYRTDNPSHNAIVQSLNVIVDRLTTDYKLPAGPDLYRYFEQNPTHLRDGLHPTYTDGVRAIQRLWAEAACKL